MITINPPILFKNIIICSHSMFEELKSRGYNKEIYAHTNCPNHEWYYFSKAGQMRIVKKDVVWTSIPEIVGNIEFPSGYLRKIR